MPTKNKKRMTVKNKTLEVFKGLPTRFHVYDLIDPVVDYFKRFKKRPTHGTILRELRFLREEGKIYYTYINKKHRYLKAVA